MDVPRMSDSWGPNADTAPLCCESSTLRAFVQRLLPDLKVPDHPILPAGNVMWYG